MISLYIDSGKTSVDLKTGKATVKARIVAEGEGVYTKFHDFTLTVPKSVMSELAGDANITLPTTKKK